jgi:nicotinamide mononucleotide (NMN) deamidase PncC
VYLGVAIGGEVHTKRLSLTGNRVQIRAAAVAESLQELTRLLQ